MYLHLQYINRNNLNNQTTPICKINNNNSINKITYFSSNNYSSNSSSSYLTSNNNPCSSYRKLQNLFPCLIIIKQVLWSITIATVSYRHKATKFLHKITIWLIRNQCTSNSNYHHHNNCNSCNSSNNNRHT